MQNLRSFVLQLICSSCIPLTVKSLENQLRSSKIQFTRDGLRSIIWRLADDEWIAIDPECKLIPGRTSILQK